MNIIPLSKKYLEETIKMVNSVFPDDVKEEWSPDRSFRLGMRFSEDLETGKADWFKKLGYWIVLDDVTGEVVGSTGLYQPGDEVDDDMDAVWVGWYCVRGDQRGKGLGRELLEWTIQKAKNEGYKKLKLYTSTDPNEARAQELYEKVGLKIVGQEPGKSGYKTLYREKIL